jgi:hypothetical protein
VNFVDDEDLVARAVGEVADVVAQLADIVDAGVGGAVDLDDVETLAGGDFGAGGAGAAGGGGLAGFAVECLGQDARRRGFADATGAGKEKGVVDASRTNGVGQGAADVLQVDQVGEILGAPLAGEDQLGHGSGERMMQRTGSCRHK